MFKKTLSILAVIFTLLLISCSDDNSPTAPVTPGGGDNGIITVPAKTLTGTLMRRVNHMISQNYTLEPWNKGEATILFFLSTTDTVARGTVSADGSYTVNFKTDMPADLFSVVHLLMQGVSGNPADLQWTIPFMSGTMMVYYPGQELVGKNINFNILNQSDPLLPVQKRYTFSCFENNGTVSGTVTNTQDVYNLNATKGWNIISYEVTNVVDDIELWKTEDNLPQNAVSYIDEAVAD